MLNKDHGRLTAFGFAALQKRNLTVCSPATAFIAQISFVIRKLDLSPRATPKSLYMNLNILKNSPYVFIAGKRLPVHLNDGTLLNKHTMFARESRMRTPNLLFVVDAAERFRITVSARLVRHDSVTRTVNLKNQNLKDQTLGMVSVLIIDVVHMQRELDRSAYEDDGGRQRLTWLLEREVEGQQAQHRLRMGAAEGLLNVPVLEAHSPGSSEGLEVAGMGDGSLEVPSVSPSQTQGSNSAKEEQIPGLEKERQAVFQGAGSLGQARAMLPPRMVVRQGSFRVEREMLPRATRRGFPRGVHSEAQAAPRPSTSQPVLVAQGSFSSAQAQAASRPSIGSKSGNLRARRGQAQLEPVADVGEQAGGDSGDVGQRGWGPRPGPSVDGARALLKRAAEHEADTRPVLRRSPRFAVAANDELPFRKRIRI
jgi:hypothetical protein